MDTATKSAHIPLLRYPFDQMRSTTAAGFFIQRYKLHNLRDISIQNCMNLLYMADKYAYRDHMQPITGDALFLFPSGPALLNVMRILCAPEQDTSAMYWNTIIESSIHRTLRIKDTTNAQYAVSELGHLSEDDVTTLINVWNEFRDTDATGWAEYFRSDQCPELVGPVYSGKPVTPADILKQYGYGDAAINAAIANMQTMADVEIAMRKPL